MAHEGNAPALTFENVTLEVIVREDHGRWVRGSQVASALGYTNVRRGLSELYDRNAAEFTDRETAVVKLPTAGGVQDVRIFSPRGAWLLGMFARTERAAAFRRWVLDVLEQQQGAPAALPAPAAAELQARVQQLEADRAVLHGMLQEQLLERRPHYKRVIYYYGIPGLTHAERALLMGWKTSAEWFKALKELAAVGLVDYRPDPRLSATGRSNHEKLQHRRAAGAAPAAGAKRPTHPSRLRPSTAHPPDHMERMRAAKRAKDEARRAAALAAATPAAATAGGRDE